MFIEQNGSYNTPYKYNGKELDEETGLYYYGARYYNPELSLWLSVDPMVEKYPAFSPYNYTLNNPIIATDPDGRAPGRPLTGSTLILNPYTMMEGIKKAVKGFGKLVVETLGLISKLGDYHVAANARKYGDEQLASQLESGADQAAGMLIFEALVAKGLSKTILSATKGLRIGNVDDFISSQTSRLNKKLGNKVGTGELPFPKGKEGYNQAIESVKSTLENPSQITDVIPKSKVKGDYDLVHIYSETSGNTVSIRVLENGKYEFDTLISGKSSKFE